MDESAHSTVAQLIDARLGPLEEGQRNTTKVLDRLVRVVIGDPEYKQEGLVDKVKRHDDTIAGWREELSETKGAVKASIWLGGTIFTVLNAGIQIWFAARGH